VVLFGLVGLVHAATLEWDRNTETDMKDYQVWACFTANCVVIKSAATLQPGAVVQPAVGVIPSYILNITGLEGSVAISARDLSLNESALSVPVPFDAKAPGVPVAPRFR
jgi:hypothetical protein